MPAGKSTAGARACRSGQLRLPDLDAATGFGAGLTGGR